MHRRTDANSSDIVKALRKAGAKVVSLSDYGHGLTDLLVGFRGVNYLIEIKDGNKSASRRKLTRDQKVFHATWPGQKAIATNSEEALKIIGAI